jgi:hypothetical protein
MSILWFPWIGLFSTWHRQNYNASSCTYRCSPDFFRNLRWMTQVLTLHEDQYTSSIVCRSCS